MALFPNFWELLLPNWNVFTGFGVLFIILGIITFIPQVTAFLRTIGFKPISIGLALLGLGVVLVWGVSILQDFLQSTGGVIIFWGLIATAFIGFVLFYQPKKK